MKRKNKMPIILIVILLAIILICLIRIYQNIEVKNPQEYEAIKASYTKSSQTVETEEQKSQTIADMIEETTRKVVRNIKIKKYRKHIINRCIRKRFRIRKRSNSISKWIYIKQ